MEKKARTVRYSAVKKMVDKGMSIYSIAKKFNVADRTIDRCLEEEDDVQYKPRPRKNGKSPKAKVERAQKALEVTNGAYTDTEALLMIKGVALLEGKEVSQMVREMFDAYRKVQKRSR